MNCPKCGASNTDGFRFCATCGTVLPTAPSGPETGPAFSAPRPKEKAPKRKKGPLVAVLCIALVAVILLGVAAWFVLSTPTNQLLMAMQKSGKALEEYVEQVDRLESFGENFQALLEKQAFTAEFAAEMDSTKLELDVNYSQKSKAATGELSYRNYYGDNDVRIQFSATESLIQLSAEPYVTDVYGLPLKNLKENLEGSYFAQMTGITLPEEFELFSGDSGNPLESYREELDALIDSLVVTDTGKQTISLDGRDKSCTAYEVAWSNQAFADLVAAIVRDTQAMQNGASTNEAYLERQERQIASMKEEIVNSLENVKVVFYTNDGYLVGMDVTTGYGSTAIRLEGNKNLWENIAVTELDVTGRPKYSFTLLLDADENGLKLEAYSGDDGSLMKLTYDNSDGSFRLYDDDDEVQLSGTIRDSDEGVELTLNQDWEYISLKLDPLEEQPKNLSKDYVNILEMSENEWLRLTRDLSDMVD